MSVRVLVDGSGPGVQLPAHMTRIPISSIAEGTDGADKIVKGKMLRKGPLVSSQVHHFILKAVVQEDDSSINLVLMGALAKSFSDSVQPGDVVAVSGFSVGKSPTMHQDKLHTCNLLLSGDDACVYLFRPSPPLTPRPPPLTSKRSPALPREVSKTAKVPKYTYVRLDKLEVPAVVNVYGVVVFFKQPFRTRGTDWCSTLKILDESNQKVGCTLFCQKLEDVPLVFQNGDIIRLHRVKTQVYNGTVTLVNTFGFSALTFHGSPGGGVEPRTSSRSFHLDHEDRRRVEELRSWASGQTVAPNSTGVSLSGVQPRAFFDLVCQLLAKAPVDATCTLLRVWDGTRCPHALVKVKVEQHAMEGPPSFSKHKESLIADVLVYDNHVQVARELKPGDFLRIYNLRAIEGPAKQSHLTADQPEGACPLTFHLHGGTSYGRGIRVLSENSADVRELQRVIQTSACHHGPFEDSDSDLLDVWCTPPECLDGGAEKSWTERRCCHGEQPETLAALRSVGPGGVHHVRVQLKSYQPQRLHQALKLYCTQCKTIGDVPDDGLLAQIFSEARGDSERCCTAPWLLSGEIHLPGGTVSLHLPSEFISEGRTKELIFLQGSTLEETCLLADSYQNLVPVRSSGDGLTLLDLTAPFLFRGRKRYYGCPRCSEAILKEPVAEGDQLQDETTVAESLGVVLLKFVLVLKLELQDATDLLEVFLWKYAETFFGVSAENVAADQTSQDAVRQTMEVLCPPGGSAAQHPWLDLCLAGYRAENDGGGGQACYQICHTTVTPP